MVRAQIQVTGSKSVNVCSFYRSPNNTDSAYIDALKDAIAHIDTSADYVWIVGDFNLCDIDWQLSSIKPCCQHASMCEQLIEMANDHGLSQIVDKPMRTTSTTSKILDIYLTNCPDMVTLPRQWSLITISQDNH